MDLIKEFEKEIIELKKQKENITKINETNEKLLNEINAKKEEMEQIQDFKSAFYQDIYKEYTEKDDEFRVLTSKRISMEKLLKDNIEKIKQEKIEKLKDELKKVEENRNSEYVNITAEEAEQLRNEKNELQKQLKLNDITKDEYEKMPREEQIKVGYAKEQYLNNKHKLQEIEAKLKIVDLYNGKKPIERYTEINNEIDTINKEFTFENLDNIIEKWKEKEAKEQLDKDWDEAIKENEEFDRRKAIRKDLDERTENNKKETFEENQKYTNYSKTYRTTKPKEELREQFESLKNIKKDRIIGIEIKEGSDIINITTKNENGEKQTSKIENKIEEILKNKKKIFSEPRIEKVLNAIEPSKLKRFLLKRKLSPIVLNALNENEQKETIIDYVVAIKNKENCENLEIKHDLSHTVLKGNLKRMMKRIAKTENKIDGMEVVGLQEPKIAGLLGKRKIKNKPVTIKEGLKLFGKIKAVEKVRNFSKKSFAKTVRVTSAVKEGLKRVSEAYKENDDWENLEDLEDPDLEETEPKAQEDER